MRPAEYAITCNSKHEVLLRSMVSDWISPNSLATTKTRPEERNAEFEPERSTSKATCTTRWPRKDSLWLNEQISAPANMKFCS